MGFIGKGLCKGVLCEVRYGWMLMEFRFDINGVGKGGGSGVLWVWMHVQMGLGCGLNGA